MKPYESDQRAYRLVSDPNRRVIALKHAPVPTAHWIVSLGFLAVIWSFILLLRHLSATQPNPPPKWFIDVFQIIAIFVTTVLLVVGPAVGYLRCRRKAPRLSFDGASLSYPSLPGWKDLDLSSATGVTFIRGGYESEGTRRECGAIYQIAVRLRHDDDEFWWSVAGFSFNRRACQQFARDLARMLRVPFYETRASERVPFRDVTWTNRLFAPIGRQTPIESRVAEARTA